MGFLQGSVFLLFCMSMVTGSLCCDRCVRHSKASYFVPPMKNSGEGKCEFGAFSASLSRGAVATASSKIFRDGKGCGACYQIRCTDPVACKKSGVKVVVTDYTESNQTDFVLSSGSFSSMARPNNANANEFMKRRNVEIEYKRIPCEYAHKNLTLKVHKSSVSPNYLALQLLFQGGQTDIESVEVSKIGSGSWQYMSRSRGGAVWGLKNPPKGELWARMLVTGGFDGSWVHTKRGAVPRNWKAGDIYDSGVQITEIAQEGCFPCPSEKDWAGN